MFNDLQARQRHHELERDANNAAFHELGLRWYWDRETCEQVAAIEAGKAAHMQR